MLAIIIFLVNTFLLTTASCPFMLKAFQQAKIQQNLSLELKHNLVENGFLVLKGQPGYGFWYQPPPEHFDLLNGADLLYRTEQLFEELYLVENGGPEIFSTKKKLKLLSNMSDCLPLTDRCRVIDKSTIKSQDYLYRRIDGIFNNLERPTLGASFTGFERFVNPVYDDGIHTIRRNAINGAELPSARVIANAIFTNDRPIYPNQILSTMGLFFSQAVGAHDMNRLMKNEPIKGGSSLSCCSKDYTKMLPKTLQYDSCLPIDIPKDDPFYSKYNIKCENFIRTNKAFSSDCKLGTSHQINRQTSFIDISTLYGSIEKYMTKSREYAGGKMKTNKENVLPRDPSSVEYQYLFGDNRDKQTAILALITSLFLRLHNNIAEELAQINSHWNDETLFQEARRINIALYQHIYYTEFLPIILGHEYVHRKKLICKDKIFCGEYNSNINPSSHSEYSESAFRLFHAVVPEVIELFNSEYKKTESLWLSDIINNSTMLQTDYYGVLRGSLMQSINLKGYNQQMRTTVFKNYNKLGIGVDVSAIDIQRGRDHGLAPYYKYVEHCQPHLRKISHWHHLEPNIHIYDIEILKDIYNSVFDLDLYVGLFLERKYEYLGPVGKCIVGEQYHHTKFGDRFFYSFENGHNPFKKVQLEEILNYSFAQMLCQQTNLEKVTRKPLMVSNTFIDCSSFPKLNLTLWKENL